MNNSLTTFLWSYPLAIFGINFLLTIPTLVVIRSCRIFKAHPEINAKFDAFARTDMDRWTACLAIIANVILFGALRYLTAWLQVFICVTCLIILMIGSDVEKRPLTGLRKLLIQMVMWPTTRIHLLCSGVLWINMRTRPDKCYKKYLGPDWTPTFEGAGI